MARLTITDIEITPLIKPYDSKLLKCALVAHFAETHWLIHAVYAVEPKCPIQVAISKLEICMMQLMNYINYPYDAPCENPFSGTNEVNSWHEELKRIGIEQVARKA